ncbi:MAG: T9SS type A sorting domain-containing protein [Bacteroidetes bacterium]|nr:T9SS type A sorting domain-containing protein [Bacteroidota bacterium]
MKAKFHLLLLMLLVSIRAAASTDSLRRLEMFIDTDPGVGNGTQYTIPTQRDTFNSSTISMWVPLYTAPGSHMLYVRAFADSSGHGGRWGMAQGRPFEVPVWVSYGEYFWDTDPGLGQGTIIPINTPADTVIQSINLNTASLQPGLHTLYVRTKDNRGFWGQTQAQQLYVLEYVKNAEYFIDTDPGVGKGATFYFRGSHDTVSKTLSIVLPSNLEDGKHVLYVRTHSSGGKWSLARAQEFFVHPQINAAEYFFDTDPGVGLGSPLSVSTPSDTINGSYSISVRGLDGGMHRLYVRTRSTTGGRWSIAQEQSFYLRERIVAAEYFWDSDPGEGSGMPLSVLPKDDSVQATYTIKTPCTTAGVHHLYFRTKDEHGHWSIAQEDTVTITNPTVVATADYPGPGPYGTPVKLSGSGGIPPYSYKLGVGSPISDSIFLVPNGASSLSFTVYDTCGHSGSTTVSTPATPTIIAGDTVGHGSVKLNAFRYWVYVLDSNGYIIGAARDYGQMLDTITMNYYKNRSGTVRSYPISGIKYLDRNWYVTTNNAPNSDVGVQLFAVDSEFNALSSADPAVTTKSALSVVKYDGTNEDLSVANNARTYVLLTPDSTVTFTGVTSAGNGYAFVFAVSDFSEFYESRNAPVILPICNVELQSQQQGKDVLLEWHTKGERGTTTHTLLRGPNPDVMQVLNEQAAKSGTENSYSFLDVKPLEGVNYYRVKVQDISGAAYYSQMVVVRINDNRLLSVTPNPARDEVHISGLEPGDQLSLLDPTGRAVWTHQATGQEMQVGTAQFASGVYLLRVDARDGTRQSLRIELLH